MCLSPLFYPQKKETSTILSTSHDHTRPPVFEHTSCQFENANASAEFHSRIAIKFHIKHFRPVAVMPVGRIPMILWPQGARTASLFDRTMMRSLNAEVLEAIGKMRSNLEDVFTLAEFCSLGLVLVPRVLPIEQVLCGHEKIKREINVKRVFFKPIEIAR